MAGNFKVLDKKTLVAIIIIVVLIIAAIVGTVAFLKNRGTTEATDLASYNEQSTQTTQDEQETTETQEQSGDTATQSAEEQTTQTTEDTETANVDTTTTENNQEENVTGAGATGTTETTSSTQTTGGTTTATDNIQESTITREETVTIPEQLVAEGEDKTWRPTELQASIIDGFHNLTVQTPDIIVTKEAKTSSGNNLVQVGETITYTVKVKNTSAEPVEKIYVTDNIPEKTTYLSSEDNAQKFTDAEGKVISLRWVISLEANEEKTLQFQVTVNEDATGTIRNVAIANGEESNETVTSIIKTKKTSVITRNGNIVEGPAKLNDEITYTIWLTNTGDEKGETIVKDKKLGEMLTNNSVEFVSGIKVYEDENNRDEELNKLITDGITVKVNKETKIEFTVKVKSTETKLVNIATVGEEVPTNPEETETTGFSIKKEATLIENTEIKDGKAQAGDQIEYAVYVSNDGTTKIEGLTVTDEKLNITVTGIQLNPLQKDKEVIRTTYLVTDADVENIENNPQIINTAVASYNGEEKDATVNTPVEEMGEVTVEKTATAINGDTNITGKKVEEDDVITYTITVKNTGNVTLSDVKITDDLKVNYKASEETEGTEVTAGNVITTIETLEPGETETIEVDYIVTQNDVDTLTEIRNVATATGTTPSGEEETDNDDDITVPTDKTAGIEVTKTATEINGEPVTINGETGKVNEAVEQDDVITYTITVKNTGNVTLSDVKITDDLKVNYKASEETEGTEVTAGNVITTIETLEPGETETIEVDYIVTQNDVDTLTEIRNVATATGTTPSGEEETDNDDDTTVPTVEPEPEMNLTVVPTTSEAQPQNVILVLDFSSSMEGETKIGALKTAVSNFLDDFLGVHEKNKVKIIEYAKDILETSKDWSSNRTDLDISNDQIDNGTNTDLGLTSAYHELLSMTPEERAKTSVILMSDGEPYCYCVDGTYVDDKHYTVGYNDETIEDLAFYAQQANDTATLIKNLGIKLYSIGFDISEGGSAYNLTKDIASSGKFVLAEDGEQLIRTFDEICTTITSIQDETPVSAPVKDGIATINPQSFEDCQNVEIYTGGTYPNATLVETHTWSDFEKLVNDNGEKIVDFDENGNMVFNLEKYKQKYLNSNVTDVTIRFVDGQIQSLSLFSQLMSLVETDENEEIIDNMINDIDATKQKVESTDTTTNNVTDSNSVQENPSVDETIPEDTQTNLDTPTNVPKQDENVQKPDETTDTSTDTDTNTDTDTDISTDGNEEQVEADNTSEAETLEDTNNSSNIEE